MKKTLIALAAVAVAGAASAQVTLSGSFGMGMSDTTAGNNTWGVTDSGVTFSASEDLGGGMKFSGSQTLDMSAGHTDAATTDGFSATLSGGFGALNMIKVGADADKLGVASLGYSTNTLFGGTTAKYTAVNYTLPSLVSGLGVTVRWAGVDGVNTNASTLKAQARLTYAIGAASFAYNSQSGKSELFANYDFGVASVHAFADMKVASGDKRREYAIKAPVGPVKMGISRATKGTKKGTEFDAQYALSKRTVVRASYGSFDDAGTKSKARRVKLVHSF